MHGDVTGALEAGKVSDYRLWKKSSPEVVLHPFGLTNLGQLGPDATSFASLVTAQCRRMGTPFCSQSWHVCISVYLVHYRSLVVDYWYKAASEAVARTRDPFAFVDAPACLAQDDCDEMLVIRPDHSAL